MNIEIRGAKALLRQNDIFTPADADIYISGTQISGVGQKPAGFSADKVIDGRDRLVIPGLINAHTHSYMSLFRNVADDMAFDDWLFGHILPMEDRLLPEDMYWGTLLGCLEMIRTGTTCFVDMNIDIAAIKRAADEAGIRAVLSRGLVGQGNDEGGRRRLRENLNAYLENANDKVTFLLGPHAPYSCDPEYLKIVMKAAEKYGLGINIHLSESAKEVRDVQAQHGCTPIALMDQIGLFEFPAIAAHCVYATDEDIAIMAQKGVTVATNPKSNLKLANGAAPLLKMQAAGVNITIGTDGAASNNTLNMFGDMNYAALLHKGLNHDPLAISAQNVLRYATINAAKAVGLAGQIGEIQVGMKADLVLMNLNEPQFRPYNNIASSLVYAANGGEVETVLVNGEVLMENREMKTLDAEKIYYHCAKIMERVNPK